MAKFTDNTIFGILILFFITQAQASNLTDDESPATLTQNHATLKSLYGEYLKEHHTGKEERFVSTLYQLILDESSPEDPLPNALALCSDDQLNLLFIKVDCHYKGSFLTRNAQILHAKILERRPSNQEPTPSQIRRQKQWMEGWCQEAHITSECYRCAFIGNMPVPEHHTLGTPYTLNHGVFDPQTFLSQLIKNGATLAHIDIEQLKRTAFAWIPAFCHEATRNTLNTFLQGMTGPEAAFLQKLAHIAKDACDHHLKSLEKQTFMQEFFTEYATHHKDNKGALEDIFWKRFPQTVQNPADGFHAFMLQIKKNLAVFVSKHKINTLSDKLLDLTETTPSVLEKNVKTTCEEYCVMFKTQDVKTITHKLIAARQTSKQACFKGFLEAIHAVCVTSSANNPQKIPEDRMTYYLDKLRQIDANNPKTTKTSISALWHAFEALNLTVSALQWSTSTHILRELPWIANLKQSLQEDILVYRTQNTTKVTEPAYQTRIAYYDQHYSHLAIASAN